MPVSWPAAAHVADQLVALLQRVQPLAHLRADAARLGRHVLLLDDVQAGDAGGADQRIVGVRVGGRVARGDHFLLDRGGGGDAR